MSFDDLNIDPRCLKVLKASKITNPTPVQAQAIPVALEGCDVVAIAQTGTGKTLAFGLPALTRLANENVRGTRMLVLAPTRELAQQVHDVLDPHARALGLRTACVYGGVGMERQAQALRNGTPIIVATPGRLIDHMERGNVNFRNMSILVLDEADRMLDMGFMPSIERILEEVPKERQTMMFSATFPKEIADLTKNMQNNAVRIQVGAPASPAKDVKQSVYAVHGDKKLDLLADILRKEEATSVLVFLRTKHRTDRIAKALHKEGFKAMAIHGGRTQRQRQQAIDGFRAGHYNILVATDVAARGLDVQGISHVVNFDVPNCSDDYVHRIGRTGRANASGIAFTLVCPEEGRALREIERDLGNVIPREDWDGAIHIGNDGPSREERWGNRRRDVAPRNNDRNGFGRGGDRGRSRRPQEYGRDRSHGEQRDAPREARHRDARPYEGRSQESRPHAGHRAHGDSESRGHAPREDRNARPENGHRGPRRDSAPREREEGYTRAERAGKSQFDRVFRKDRSGDFLGGQEAKQERGQGRGERSDRGGHARAERPDRGHARGERAERGGHRNANAPRREQAHGSEAPRHERSESAAGKPHHSRPQHGYGRRSEGAPRERAHAGGRGGNARHSGRR
ncbi:MAG: DEAD/DEAH box helicase [Candidatus Hydrogenedentes bacterium]|nr:DEAD/DEAH box helicase [Candidatus Hydrogenedentota bacterium]